jgi:hypothetical protein
MKAIPSHGIIGWFASATLAHWTPTSHVQASPICTVSAMNMRDTQAMFGRSSKMARIGIPKAWTGASKQMRQE